MALEIGGIGSRIAGNKRPRQQGNKRDADDEGNDRGKRSGDAEGADQGRIRKQEGDEGGGGGGGCEHASRSDHENGIAGRFDAPVPLDQAVAHGDGELHGIGEAEHHDQRDHDVEEEIELEAEPAEQSERPDNGDDWRQRGDDHQREAPEKGIGDDRAEQESQQIVLEAIALHGVADLKLHHRRAGELHLQPGGPQFALRGVVDLLDHMVQPVALDDLAVERKQDEGEGAVVGEKLALDDLVVADLVDEGLISLALGQFGGKDRAGNLPGLGRLAGRKQRNLVRPSPRRIATR